MPGGLAPADADALTERLIAWTRSLPEPLERRPAAAGPAARLGASDLGHFCSRMVGRPQLDRVLDRFRRFCIVGQPSSVPYVRRRLDAPGKPYVVVPSYAPEVLERVEEPFDCLLVCGAQGNAPVRGPAVALMQPTGRWWTLGIEDPEIKDVVTVLGRRAAPPTSDAWFYPFGRNRLANAAAYDRVRVESTAAIRAFEEERRSRAAAARNPADALRRFA